ncbi:hypothetical protein [Mameliella sediminis]|uniref:hypothetical protein n=1 Tax=Mameliella sediminis TaxID=2836866 RepID=UPI001C4782F4|nr:hypothetical protein [Mameliella sediminis]MBY6115309.1 hypothetical protein [Antarctobacter heliothermus]MBY6144626.1 hypothetical protein [Mameliella alba]MBV7395740.1 hypothetical protein [Mameliella sediminis]MBY6160153.1 hypothetical protein [Mameliella alba]MBY6168623.1 hypothetical protein [Mameliella alba]
MKLAKDRQAAQDAPPPTPQFAFGEMAWRAPVWIPPDRGAHLRVVAQTASLAEDPAE